MGILMNCLFMIGLVVKIGSATAVESTNVSDEERVKPSLKAEAKRLYNAGIERYKENKFKEAAIYFEEASRIFPTFDALYNLAASYWNLRELTEVSKVIDKIYEYMNTKKIELDGEQILTLDNLEKSLADSARLTISIVPSDALVTIKRVKDADNKPVQESEKYLGAPVNDAPVFPGTYLIKISKDDFDSQKCTVKLSLKQHGECIKKLNPSPGRLIVRTTPQGAEIYVNQEKRGTSSIKPLELTLTPQTYSVMAKKKGYHKKSEKITVLPNKDLGLELKLRSWWRIIRTTLVSSGGTMFVGGAIVGIAAIKMNTNLENDCPLENPCNKWDGDNTSEEWKRFNKKENMKVAGIVLLSVGAAFAALGGVAFIIDPMKVAEGNPKTSKTPETPSVTPLLDKDAAGVAIIGFF